MNAYFASTCRACQTPIYVGDGIRKNATGVYVHFGCVGLPVAPRQY